jgi:hypothetical protein
MEEDEEARALLPGSPDEAGSGASAAPGALPALCDPSRLAHRLLVLLLMCLLGFGELRGRGAVGDGGSVHLLDCPLAAYVASDSGVEGLSWDSFAPSPGGQQLERGDVVVKDSRAPQSLWAHGARNRFTGMDWDLNSGPRAG